MSAYLPPETIEQVRKATDIVAIISEHLPLKHAGANYQALCPFHQEKTPSFSVNPALQIFKCFGCGKAGNVFHFLMALNHLTFPEAVKHLAERQGISLGNEENPQDRLQKGNLLELLDWSANFYVKQLVQNKGALEYIQKRGISKSIQNQFQLGFAPAGWDTLLTSARREGFSLDALEKVGLTIKSTNPASREGYYDRFRNRVMFPIGNMEGNTIAFGGRVLDAAENPKYLNSPETLFFSKSKTLYGWQFAKNSIMVQKSIIIMEGYTDVLMAHQHGFTTAVATLGTALTEEHTKIIKRYAESVTLLFDGDSAGQKAADRSMGFFLKEGILVKIVVLPDDLDPCDFLLQQGKEAFQNQIEKAEDFWDFQIRLLAKKYDLKHTASKRYALSALQKSVSLIPDEITQTFVINKLAEIFKIPSEMLRQQMLTSTKPLPPVASALPDMRQKFRAEDEKFLLWTMVHYPESIDEIATKYPVEEFGTSEYQEVAKKINEAWLSRKLEIASLTSYLEPTLAEKVVNLYSLPYGNPSLSVIKERLELIFKGLVQKKHQAELTKLREKWTTHLHDEEKKGKILEDTRRLCHTYMANKSNTV